MTDGYNPTKPAWDKSQEGALPEELSDAFANSRKIAAQQESEFEALQSLTPEQRLDRMDAIQSEATSLMDSRGAEFATEEQRFIHQWQREATVAASQLVVFRNPNNQVEGRDEKVTECSRALATALYKLGRFDDALAIASPFPELIEQIHSTIAAINKPDEELQTHSCEREQSEVDGKVIELDRHIETEQVFSPLHGKLVYVWVCGICGETNATPDKPERQQRYTDEMLATIHSLAKEGTPAAAMKLRQFAAGVVMARTN